jgi:E3 ubiquitin-protein ligase RGLG
MHKFDDELPERDFDNFQFVDFTELQAQTPTNKLEATFARDSLMELPDALKAMKKLGLLKVEF